jgi:hypothetical protein
MSIFTELKIDLPDLIKLIPDELFSGMAVDTQVDYRSKVLYGKVMFYLLPYSLMSTDKSGQRGIFGVCFLSLQNTVLFGTEAKKAVTRFGFGTAVKNQSGVFQQAV